MPARRLAHGAAGDRDPGRRRVRVHPQRTSSRSPTGRSTSSRELFRSGVRPAINVGISVSRVGGNAQITPMQQGRRPAQARPLAIPRPRGLRPVRLGPRSPTPSGPSRGASASSRRSTSASASPSPVAGPGGPDLRRHQRLPRPDPERRCASSEFLRRPDRYRCAPSAPERARRRSPGGDWSGGDPAGGPIGAVEAFAQDFGYDLDEEGLPLGDDVPLTAERSAFRRAGRVRGLARGGAAQPAWAVTARIATASQRDVENRISSVKNIQKITRAMEMVAAARDRGAPSSGSPPCGPCADALQAHDPPGRPGRRRRGPQAAAASSEHESR